MLDQSKHSAKSRLPAEHPRTRQENLIAKFMRDCLEYQLFPGSLFPVSPQGMDWGRLYIELSRQRLTGLFCALGKTGPQSWPADFYEQLRRDRYSLQFYGEQCAGQVSSVLLGLVKANIPVIALKGWAYIQTIYGGDYSQRVCEDVDILIRPEDADKAERILDLLGCVLEAESWPDYSRNYLNAERYLFSSRSGGPENGFSVGLHWGLLHIPCYNKDLIDVHALFARAHPLEVAGAHVFDLSTEDQIVYACAHLGLHHRFDNALFRYYELAAVILHAGTKLDWKRVLDLAVVWQCVLPLKFTLTTLNSLWVNIVPLPVLRDLDLLRPGARDWFVTGWVRIFRGRQTFDHVLTWFTFPDRRQRIPIMLKDVFPSPDYLKQRYGIAPLGFWPVLYLVRFVHAILLMFKRNLQS